jgi:hypothetical protein
LSPYPGSAPASGPGASRPRAASTRASGRGAASSGASGPAADDGYQRRHRSERRPGPLHRLFGRRRADDDEPAALDWATPKAPGRGDTGGEDPPAAIPTYRAQHRVQGQAPRPDTSPEGRPDADHAAQEHLAAFRPEAPAAPAPAPLALPAGSGAPGPKPPARFIPRAEEPSATPDEDGDLLHQVLGGLAMRDLTLVESLLQVVEKLESNEDDAGQLELLFRIDHLATRMRRNSENLLVLAGHDSHSQDLEPIPLLDVARAAISEITDYSRAEISSLPDVRVAGVAADDLSHILAELLENATSKSPESTPVLIRAERTGDGTMVISVEDSGIGIPADQLAAINARLGRAPVVDPSVTRRMGLYVVGRLAQRHGIRVQLRERPYGGITANVITPSRLVQADPDSPPRTARRPPGRPQPVAAAASPATTSPAAGNSAGAVPPAPRFSPADPSLLPRRSPSRSTAVTPPPGPPGPPPPAEAPGDRAGRIRDDLADFRLGQHEARSARPEVHHSNGLPRREPGQSLEPGQSPEPEPGREPGQHPGPGPAEGPSGTEAGPT